MDLVKFRTGMGRWTVVMTTQIIFRLTGRTLMMVNRRGLFLSSSAGLDGLGHATVRGRLFAMPSRGTAQQFGKAAF